MYPYSDHADEGSFALSLCYCQLASRYRKTPQTGPPTITPPILLTPILGDFYISAKMVRFSFREGMEGENVLLMAIKLANAPWAFIGDFTVHMAKR